MMINIKIAMLENNITAIELAKRIGTTNGRISSWIVGRNTPSVPFLIALSKELNRTVGYLIGVEEKRV